MQKSYVVKQQFWYSDGPMYIRVGDILVHDPLNGNKMTVYRNEELFAVTTHTQRGLTALANQTPEPWIEEITSEAIPAPVAPTPVVEEVPTVTEEPKEEVASEPVVLDEPTLEAPSEEAQVVDASVEPKWVDLKKADIVAKAKELYDLNLDVDLKKDELIAAIEEAKNQK